MSLSDRASWRSLLRAVIITAVILAIVFFIIPQAGAEDTIIFDGYVYDTDGVTPADASVVIFHPAYSLGMYGNTDDNGYYAIEMPTGAGQVTYYAFTYRVLDADHGYVDRISPNVTASLDGLADGSRVSRNLVLQAMPYRPASPVTFRGNVLRSGREAAFAKVWVSYGSYLFERAASETGYYDFQLDYVDQSVEMWVTCDGYESAHRTRATSPGGIVTDEWNLPLAAPTSTVPPSSTKAPAKNATPTPIPYITFAGCVFYNGVPVKDAGVFCTYGGSTNEVVTNGTGGYRLTRTNGGGGATLWASYFGTASNSSFLLPAYGSVHDLSFYINDTPPGDTTPAPTVAPSDPGNSTAAVTLAPTPAATATPRITPGPTGRPAAGRDIDLSSFLTYAVLIAGGIIAALLVLYCLAVLIVTKL